MIETVDMKASSGALTPRLQAARKQVSSWPFDSVLVANRGEIAVRVLRTVQALGLRGLIVHHAADRHTPAVRMADQAIEITGSTPVAAYLDGAQILDKAKAAGAGAMSSPDLIRSLRSITSRCCSRRSAISDLIDACSR